MTLRTTETEHQYMIFLQNKPPEDCFLCRAKPLKEYRYWKIVENEFPYDRIAGAHHLITLKRHADEKGLTADEHREYKIIKEMIHQSYDMIFENTHKKKSIPGHHHLHIITLKQEEAKNETNPKYCFAVSRQGVVRVQQTA